VKEVCGQPDAATWTCRVLRVDGKLPDTEAMARSLAATELFSLRGVEVTAVGTVAVRGASGDSGPVLALDGTGERVRLAPLAHKVQWSFRRQRAHPISDEEQTAWERLRAVLAGGPRRARIVGPLFEGALEVRSFELIEAAPGSGDAPPASRARPAGARLSRRRAAAP
jgi:hypothetical protein